MPCVAIDLFCGVGGLTKGLSLAGINVVAGFDINENCRFAYEINNNAEFFCSDINEIQGRQLNQLYPDNSTRVLVGCAPCQPFSRYSSRYRKDGRKDNRWRLLYSFERLIRESNPDIVSMENVPNLIHEEVFSDFVNSLVENGYYVDSRIAYCPDYGVPQKRKRLVLLASKLGNIGLIPPIYNAENYLDVRDAIGNLPPIEAGETCETDVLHHSSALSALNLQRIQQSVPGGTWREWDDELKLNCHMKSSGRTFPSVYGRMEWDKPSPTITTQFYGYGNGRFGHPEQNRAISLREGAILQSFPDDYIFVDDEHPAQKRELGVFIGNAVPVELGRAIGESIRQHVERMRGE